MLLQESSTTAGFHCSQCYRPLPVDPLDLGRWRPSDVVYACPVDDLTAMTILCPECIEDEHDGNFDVGEGD